MGTPARKAKAPAIQAAAAQTASPAGSGRQRRSTSEVRALILKAAADVFVKRGYDRASTREIAEAAGIVEPMIFRHLGTKERLFEHAVFLPFTEFVEDYLRHRQNFEFDGIPQEELGLRFVRSLYGLLHRQRGLVWELLVVGMRSDWRLVHTDAADSPFGQLFRELDEIAVRQTKAGRQRGSDPRLVTRLTFGSVLAIAILGEWLFPDPASRPSEDQVIDELSKFLLYGTSPHLEAAQPNPLQAEDKPVKRSSPRRPAPIDKKR